MPALVAALVLGLLGSVVGVVVVGLTAGPAYAADYRYWSYWKSAGGPWAYSNVGAASKPADGAVEGWRFGVGSPSAVPRPRPAPDFATTCSGTAAAAGAKRVAVVVDFGVAADAPPGESPPGGATATCVSVPANANGYQALQEAFRIRTNASGLVCGIHGYPARECGAAATTAAPAAPTPTPGTPQATPAPTAAAAPAAPSRTAPSPTSSASPGSPPPAPAAGATAPDAGAGPAGAADPAGDPDAAASPSPSALRSGSTDGPTGSGPDAVDAGDDAGGDAGSGSGGSPVVLVLSVLAAAAVAATAYLRGRRARRS